MKVSPTSLPEVLLVDLDVFPDERGYFVEIFHEARFGQHGLPSRFRQDNQSRSRKDVLRGLHYQLRQPQGRLIACVRGAIFDVAVDIRPDSPNFKKWFGVELSEDAHRLLWIPPGFAHGFCVLSDSALVQYKCTEIYDTADDRGILWSDPQLSIQWPLSTPILSQRDMGLPTLTDVAGDLPRYSAKTAATP